MGLREQKREIADWCSFGTRWANSRIPNSDRNFFTGSGLPATCPIWDFHRGLFLSLLLDTQRMCKLSSCVTLRLRRFWRSRAVPLLSLLMFLGMQGRKRITVPSPDLEAGACLWIMQLYSPTGYVIDGTKLFAGSGSFKIAYMLKQSSNRRHRRHSRLKPILTSISFLSFTLQGRRLFFIV